MDNNSINNTKDRVIATIQVVALLIIIIIIAFLSTACNSKSGHLDQINPEKVIIIDEYPSNIHTFSHGKMYRYKVNRIEKGVMTTIYDYNQYEKGDTIYHCFINKND